MGQEGSALRRLAVADFAADQVSGWLAATAVAPKAAPAAGEGEASDWVVAYTDPRCEERVRTTMLRRSLDAYVPAMTVTRRRADVRRPVFPRYVFVGLKAGQSTYLLADTPGLGGLVRRDGAPVRLDARIVRGLRRDEAAGVFDFTAGRARAAAEAQAAEAEQARVAAIQPGRRVRMVGGTWRQFGGEVLALMSGARVLVDITLFARSMPVPIPLAHVQLVA